MRATAAETLTSGLGYCGEVSRAFINLAMAAGIRAARLNLYGRSGGHVVAYAELSEREHVIVDSQRDPKVPELDSLDAVMSRHQYDEYSTLNLRRLHLESIFTRTKMALGPLTLWGENPHAMRATAWALVALGLVALRALRLLVRRFLQWRGWVHRSTLPQGFAPGE